MSANERATGFKEDEPKKGSGFGWFMLIVVLMGVAWSIIKNM